MIYIHEQDVWRFDTFYGCLDGSTRILALQINNGTYPILGATAINGYNFRLVIELWTWKVQSTTLRFGWSAGGERKVACVQVWLNMTSPVPH